LIANIKLLEGYIFIKRFTFRELMLEIFMSNYKLLHPSTEQFCEHIRSFGLEPPPCIEPGKWHRFPGLNKKSSNKAGWCLLFPDGIGGVFGDFTSSLNESWQNTSKIRTRKWYNYFYNFTFDKELKHKRYGKKNFNPHR